MVTPKVEKLKYFILDAGSVLFRGQGMDAMNPLITCASSQQDPSFPKRGGTLTPLKSESEILIKLINKCNLDDASNYTCVVAVKGYTDRGIMNRLCSSLFNEVGFAQVCLLNDSLLVAEYMQHKINYKDKGCSTILMDLGSRGGIHTIKAKDGIISSSLLNKVSNYSLCYHANKKFRMYSTDKEPSTPKTGQMAQ
eukprot:UN33764